MAWILVPCLQVLRAELDELGPDRDRSSDGTIGDQAHAGRPSDHNPDETGATSSEDADARDEVHALDVDRTGPWLGGFTLLAGAELIRARCEAGLEDRLQNIIFARRIASRSWGWGWRDYDGPNPHLEHAHFGARYDTGKLEDDTRPWGLVERWGTMPLTSDDIKRIWAYDPGNNANGDDNGGVGNPGWKKPGDNATFNPAYGIGRAVVGLDVGYQVRARVDTLTDMVKALSTLVSHSAAADEETDVEVLRRLNTAIAAAESAPSRTVDALAGGSDAEVAQVLITVLGPARAAAVAALLAG